MKLWPVFGLIQAEDVFGDNSNNIAFVTSFCDYRQVLVSWRSKFVNLHDSMAPGEGIVLRRLGNYVYALETLQGFARRVASNGWEIGEL
jgi:hypothetical protein